MRMLCVAVCVLAVTGLVHSVPPSGRHTRSDVQKVIRGTSAAPVDRPRPAVRVDRPRPAVRVDRPRPAVRVDRPRPAVRDTTAGLDPEVTMNISEIIRRWDYPAEDHDVVTSDGYILSVTRIPHGVKDTTPGPKPAVLLQHGLLGSAGNWVSNPPNVSLAFVLADAGYDVWLGNSRGNTWSRRHTTLSPQGDDFWKFSYDEMALKDIPAVVDHILKTTGQEQIFYIGHCQGTTIAFIAFSSMPELSSKIKLFVGLAPVATVDFISSPLAKLAVLPEVFIRNLFGRRDFLPQSGITKWFAESFCRGTLLKRLCGNVYFLLNGFNGVDPNFNTTRIVVYTAHNPAGTSVQNLIHWDQAVHSRKLQGYDFGRRGNLAHYNQSTPPQYYVEDMKVPTALFSGGKDLLADPRDVDVLLAQVSNLVFHKRIEDWRHLDFTWALDAPEQMYSDILRLMRTYA